ncbi:MAG TPA: hypothetical protein VNW99_03525 [Cytophagaceae bacterium]|jgi:hypothetical protein|nr:hypothetical protein [Cytophagaceae bacterium]
MLFDFDKVIVNARLKLYVLKAIYFSFHMKIERYFIFFLFACIFLRYTFQYFAFPVLANLFIHLVFLLQIALLVLFFIEIKNTVCRIVLTYYMIGVLAIIFELNQWKGAYPLLFIGSLGNFLFPVYVVYTRRKFGFKGVLPYLVVLGIFLWTQNIFLFFIPVQNNLSMAHTTSYFIAATCFYILFNETNANSLSEDERKIVVFILIAAVLSALGVTFKEKFYVH